MRVYFLDTPFDLVPELKVLSFLSSGFHRFNDFQYIVTPNADHVVRNMDVPSLRVFYHQALLSVCDSRVVARLARMRRFPISEVVTGSDLVFNLFHKVLRPEHRVTIVGCDKECVRELTTRFRLENVFHHNPEMGFIEDDVAVQECCDFVGENPADFVLLAVGSPQQEILASRLKREGTCRGLGLCIGASLLFLTGSERRAPRFLSNLGAEWLYRLLQNPRRLWHRYFHDLRIFDMAFKSPIYNGQSVMRILEGFPRRHGRGNFEGGSLGRSTADRSEGGE